jgi:hypothetical protein
MDIVFFGKIFDCLNILRSVIGYYNFEGSPSTEEYVVDELCYSLEVFIPECLPFRKRRE